MGNNNSNRRVNDFSYRELPLPVAIPLMIPVVEAKPLREINIVPSAPPIPSAPPLEESSNLTEDPGLYYRALVDSINTSRKTLARDMLAYNRLNNDELMKCVEMIDILMVRYPKNKTRPIIRKMIMAKIDDNIRYRNIL